MHHDAAGFRQPEQFRGPVLREVSALLSTPVQPFLWTSSSDDIFDRPRQLKRVIIRPALCKLLFNPEYLRAMCVVRWLLFLDPVAADVGHAGASLCVAICSSNGSGSRSRTPSDWACAIDVCRTRPLVRVCLGFSLCTWRWLLAWQDYVGKGQKKSGRERP